jgi:drug/metabolite transporter superfamily protein YnfA
MVDFITNVAWLFLIMFFLAASFLIYGLFSQNKKLTDEQRGYFIITTFVLLLICGVCASWIWR